MAQPRVWEAKLAVFLRVYEAGDIPSQRRQAQEFVDKLDAVCYSGRVVYPVL